MATLDDVSRLVAADNGLGVVTARRSDGSVQATVVNVGVLDHPVTGDGVVGCVLRGGTYKLRYLRADPEATVTVRVGWEWATVEGVADLIGPDDPYFGFTPSSLPQLLRDVFTAAGGTHDDWDTYDEVMAEERRCAVLVRPTRIYSNPA